MGESDAIKELREVINGNRKSKRLMARLRDAGIKVVA
jgi:hypothetical protein